MEKYYLEQTILLGEQYELAKAGFEAKAKALGAQLSESATAAVQMDIINGLEQSRHALAELKKAYEEAQKNYIKTVEEAQKAISKQ